jgi:methylenetetrahydrofolate--tRNA-(uracil-5-)-methyltransferase
VEVPRIPGKKLRGSDKALARKQAITTRALADLDDWLSHTTAVAAE